jgi:hypothetical protein
MRAIVNLCYVGLPLAMQIIPANPPAPHNRPMKAESRKLILAESAT